MGGFAGALAAFLIYARKKRLNLIASADALIFGLPLGLGCGRIGCFLVHDHPGTMTDFFLGVKQSGGGAIHDHGLYLSLNGFALALAFYLLSRKKRKEGFFVQVFLIWYGAVRFFLDFFRAQDAVYLGLTPAQYFSILMFATGLIWAFKVYKKSPLKSPVQT